MEEFVRTYVAEVNAINRERGARQAGLAQQRAKLGKQIRNLLNLMKEGAGSPALVGELRDLERHDVLPAFLPRTTWIRSPFAPGRGRGGSGRGRGALE